jgi:protease I
MAKIAFLLDNLFEDVEFKVPFDRVREAGHEAVLVGLEKGKRLHGKKGKERASVQVAASQVEADDFDALVIPGGYSPDLLRTDPHVVELIRGMNERQKPIAAICHAGWLLAEADIIRGRTLTSWPSIRTDLLNAGAEWVDQELTRDGNLITSRRPSDLDAFCDALLDELESPGARSLDNGNGGPRSYQEPSSPPY